MKLNEIVITTHPLNTPDVEPNAFDEPKFMGYASNSIDGYKLYISNAKNGKNTKKLSLMDKDGNEVALLVGCFFKFQKTGETFFKIDRAWTNPNSRQKGLMSGLFNVIKGRWNVSFMSDRDLTQQGLGMWRKFKNVENISIYDGITGKRIPWTNNTEKEIFISQYDFDRIKKDINHPLNIKANRFYLVTEAKELPRATYCGEIGGIPHIPIDIMCPYISFLKEDEE